MTARLCLDTNILIYALDPADPVKRKVSADLLKMAISSRILTLSPQSLNESYRVLTERPKLMPVAAVRSYLDTLAPWCIAPLDAETTKRAWTVQDETNYSWWDSLMLAAALRAGCRIFVSEDLADGHEISGMRISNPFTEQFAAGLAKGLTRALAKKT
jgi:predicted nucleic acid-binding protein